MKVNKSYPTTSLKLTDSQFGFLLVLPAVLVFVSIILYPFISSLVLSLFEASFLKTERTFIGLGNFIEIVTDPNFLKVLQTTLIFVLSTTLISFILGFMWAIVLNQGFKGSEFLRGLTLVNWIIPGTAIGFLWMWIFHGQFGVLNYILRSLGLIESNISWLGHPRYALLAVIIARVWQYMPWFMALLLGGLNGVSYEQIEAARVDGASNWKVLRHIVIPSMINIISLVLILGVIAGLQHFDIIWVMTAGGPARATTTLSIEVYKNAFQNWDLGKAASIGAIWVVLISGIMFFYVRRQSREL